MTLDENLVDDADHARGKGKRSEDERWGEVGAWTARTAAMVSAAAGQ